MFNQAMLQRLQQLRKQREEQSFLNVQSLYNLGFPVEQYVQLGSITADDYKQITGKDWVGPAAASASTTESTAATGNAAVTA